jgi:hypothetical protein
MAESRTVKRLLGEAPERRGPKVRMANAEFTLDGVVMEGIDIELAPDPEMTTEQRFNFFMAMKSAILEVCARPEFAKVVKDVTGYS